MESVFARNDSSSSPAKVNLKTVYARTLRYFSHVSEEPIDPQGITHYMSSCGSNKFGAVKLQGNQKSFSLVHGCQSSLLVQPDCMVGVPLVSLLRGHVQLDFRPDPREKFLGTEFSPICRQQSCGPKRWLARPSLNQLCADLTSVKSLHDALG